jgi:hypothetical protein
VITWRLLHGDVRERLRELPAQSVQCCVIALARRRIGGVAPLFAQEQTA